MITFGMDPQCSIFFAFPFLVLFMIKDPLSSARFVQFNGIRVIDTRIHGAEPVEHFPLLLS
jgi:hypothetical protein